VRRSNVLIEYVRASLKGVLKLTLVIIALAYAVSAYAKPVVNKLSKVSDCEATPKVLAIPL